MSISLAIKNPFSLEHAKNFIFTRCDPAKTKEVLEKELKLIDLAAQVFTLYNKNESLEQELKALSKSNDPAVYFTTGSLPGTVEGWSVFSVISSSGILSENEQDGSKTWELDHLPPPNKLLPLKKLLSHYQKSSVDQRVIGYCRSVLRLLEWSENVNAVSNLYENKIRPLAIESAELVQEQAQKAGEDFGRVIPIWTELYSFLQQEHKFHSPTSQNLLKEAHQEGYPERQKRLINVINQEALQKIQRENALKSADDLAKWIEGASSSKGKKQTKKTKAKTLGLESHDPLPPSPPENKESGSSALAVPEIEEMAPPFHVQMEQRIAKVHYQTRVTRWAKIKSLEQILTFPGYENKKLEELPSILKAHFFPGVERLLQDEKFKQRYTIETRKGAGLSLTGELDGVPVIITIAFDQKGRVYHKYAQPIMDNNNWGRGLLYLFDLYGQIKPEDTFNVLDDHPNALLYENERFAYNSLTGTFSIEDTLTSSTLVLNPLRPEVEL